MTNVPPAESFQDMFCAQYGVPPALYSVTVLRLTLYSHARWLADLSPPDFLAADRIFIAAVGRLTRWRDFSAAVHDFQSTAANRRFWRRSLRLRVSVARMRALFSEVMGGTTCGALPESQARSRASGEPGSFATQ